MGLCATILYKQQQELNQLKRDRRRRRRRVRFSLSTDQPATATDSSTCSDSGDEQHSEKETHPAHFTPHHITATAADLAGNGGAGRYFLLPGSNARAARIAAMFREGKEGVVVRRSSRGHDVYLGSLASPGSNSGAAIDVGVVATGMGCPSVDIVVTELVKLGARRFIRVGTAGSLQPAQIRVGDVVIASAAVRDEGTSRHYAPIEFPAVAAPEVVQALRTAAGELGAERTGGREGGDGEGSERRGGYHCGVVHTKDSLYAREFGEGALVREHGKYMRSLKKVGVLASEMEAAHLFTLAHAHSPPGSCCVASGGRVMCGAVLGIVGDDAPFADKEKQAAAVTAAIALALRGVAVLHWMEEEKALAEVETRVRVRSKGEGEGKGSKNRLTLSLPEEIRATHPSSPASP